ncbi:polysaccharide deacetylase family protein [Amycolatopsis sp. NPDC051903]|uniref:polysaccharide deacetylase family protein n=1 Tax=Amycolatopsis sp. NPDC051903 TaxID=3363936 RepID=UPI0037984376
MAAQKNPPYRHWPRPGRPGRLFPGGRRMACYVAVNVEHFEPGRPSTSRTSVTAGLPVDPLNHGWRDYGARIGFWRLLRAIDAHELPVSALLNSDAAERYPEIVAAGRERGWAFLGHGRTNSRLWTGLDPETERAELTAIRDVLTEATGSAPRGWLGPALTETEHTVDLLAELGFTYSLDWIADDFPFPIEVSSGVPFASVPYSIEINDIPVFVDQGLPPSAFTQLVADQFTTLHEESADQPGAVFTLSLHPFLVGQPFRARALAEALAVISGHPDVWYANSDRIAEWYLAEGHAADRREIDRLHDNVSAPSGRR